jgi:threonine dehydrogenase-like Zn-dependent dehydrogenase
VERPVPELPGPGWVRLKTVLGGICGTDLAMITQRIHPATILQIFTRFPAVLGHENVAVIEQIAADDTEWQPGQRVCVEPAIGCVGRGLEPPCDQCAAGRSALCQQVGDHRLPPRALIGLNSLTGGSWTSYFVAHSSQLHAVPDGVADDTAVLVDPVASAAHAVLRRRPRSGESVLVNGSGIIGLGIVAAIRALGCDNEITVTVRHPFQADLVSRLGATRVVRQAAGTRMAGRFEAIARCARARRLPGRFGNQALLGGFDLIFDCTGTGAGLSDALKWTTSRGTLVAVGTSSITLLDTTPIWFDELCVIGANGRQTEDLDGRAVHTYDLVLDWLRSGRLDLSAIPVHRYRLVDYRTAFAHLLDRRRHPIVKAAFVP